MKTKENYISLARVICALAVVTIHVNACSCWQLDEQKCWHIGNIMDCICSFAVPIFIMITAATLVDYSDRYSTKEYFKKRLTKTFIPYIIWSVIGKIYEVTTNQAGVYFLYYFFLGLFGVYLSIPLFTFIKKEYKEKVFLYLLLVSFVINYLVPFGCSLFNYTNVYAIPFSVGKDYLIYVFAGYLISKREIPVVWRIVSYIGSVVGIGLQYGLSLVYGVANNEYRAYTGLPCFLVAIGVFVFLKQLGQKIKNERVNQIIDFLSSYTFSVYLIHWYVIVYVTKTLVTSTHSIFVRLGTPVLTFTICVLIIWVARKIPLVKKLFP